MSTGYRQSPAGLRGNPAPEPRGLLPPWSAVLAVVAHPDDESFGLGAIIGTMTLAGAAVHVLCYTRGEASTLNQAGADLLRQRARELRQAGVALGVATVALLDYPDGRLAEVPAAELAAHVTGLAARYRPGGLLVFDDTGITGHPDHRAATQSAIRAARRLRLPVLAWALPAGIAARLRAETGQPFAGQAPGRLDFAIRVSRVRQRQAALRHVSQVSPGAPVWRRLELQGNIEHLRWLVPPPAQPEPARPPAQVPARHEATSWPPSNRSSARCARRRRRPGCRR